MSSRFKYFGDTGGPDTPHRGNLHWPGTSAGFPVRSDQPRDLRGREREEIPHVLDYHADKFRLWMEQDFKDFTDIMDRAANGLYMIRNRKDFWKPEHESYLVWLEWLQIYGEHPEDRVPKKNNGRQANAIGRPGVPRGSGHTAGGLPIDEIPLAGTDTEAPDGAIV